MAANEHTHEKLPALTVLKLGTGPIIRPVLPIQPSHVRYSHEPKHTSQPSADPDISQLLTPRNPRLKQV